MSDEPPILPVGTAVSAKYKGAFCEAKVSKVIPLLRYRVAFKEPNMGTDTLKEEYVKSTGVVRVGRSVLAWHHGQKAFLDAQVTRIQDQSQYTVVFDDGDITTLRRNYLCLKSGRHFNESETLDQLPLTHPEHFSNPVVGGRSRRRNRNRGDDSEGEHEEADPEMECYNSDVGRVVWGENQEKKRNGDWPPGLIMLPKNPKILNTKEEFLIRSFRDDRFYNVPKKDVIEFNKEIGEKLEKSNTPFYIGVQKALRYLNTGELPANWEKHFLFHSDRIETDTELNFSDSSDDEPCEEKDRFVAQLYKFLDEAGTPLNKTPTIGGEDVDLCRLFSAVNKLGGYNKVTNNNKWKTVSGRLKYGNSQSLTNQVKQVYKKCLLGFETFYKTLGVTMLNHTKSSKKNKGRSLIRDKDRATPINSPRPDKEDEQQDKKEEEKPPPEERDKSKRRSDIKEDKKKKEIVETSGSSSDTTDIAEASTSKDLGRPRRSTEVKSWAKEKKVPKVPPVEKVKAVVEKIEEQIKKEDEKDKVQQTRSKSQLPRVMIPIVEKKPELKTPTPKEVKENKESKEVKDNKAHVAKAMKKVEEDKDKDKSKRARKRSYVENEVAVENPVVTNINIGDKLKVYYGPSIESKITYEAKVVEIDKEETGPLYLVHYTGWNTRYDEWVSAARVAENLSAATKAKRLKHGTPGTSGAVTPKGTNSPASGSGKVVTKKKKSPPESRRTSSNELPRSTTPLSSTSNSSRPKTPATPATRSATRSAKQEQNLTRRTSVQTDTSIHTDTESPASESEPELSRTRSGGKNDEPELRTYKRKVPRIPVLHKARPKAREDDDDTEKEEEQLIKERPKRTRKIKRPADKIGDESDDDGLTIPKGRDFDLNQIRSELKGFAKAVPVSTTDSAEKDTSSDESAKPLITLHITAEEDEEDFETEKLLEKIEEKPILVAKPLEKSSSSEDIYEFKEPEPFEFESRSMLTEDKNKKRLPRFYDDAVDKLSPKSALAKSPARSESSIDLEKKILRSPIKTDDFDEDDEEEVKPKLEIDDPFDKLVESPCYNILPMGKSTDTVIGASSKPVVVEEPLQLFRETPETVDDCSRDMELSDTESQTQPIFTTRNEEVFSDAFTKSSSEQNTLDLEFAKSEDRSVDEDIQASIQRVIEQAPSTDDDTRDVPIRVTSPVENYQVKMKAGLTRLTSNLLVQDDDKETDLVDIENPNDLPEKSAFALLKQMSPAPSHSEKQTETVTPQSPIETVSCQVEVLEEQSIESLKPDFDSVEDELVKNVEKVDEVSNEEVKINQEETEMSESADIKQEDVPSIPENNPDIEVKFDTEEGENESEHENLSSCANIDMTPETKKRKKIVSRPFIDSDCDSSDSDNLVIARSDDESQTNSILDDKEVKDNWDSNMSMTRMPLTMTDDSQTVQEEQRNFKFENDDDNDKPKENEDNDTQSNSDLMDIEEENKEEEPDSHLHSMLLCEETIPRSPAPASDTADDEPIHRSQSALEMPFASVPGTSNNKNLLLNPEPVNLLEPSTSRVTKNETMSPRKGPTKVLNSPPSSPESTISNLSPGDDNGGFTPEYSRDEHTNTCDNDYQSKRSNTNKMSSCSDEDSQMACDTPKNSKCEPTASLPDRKRRRSYRVSDHTPTKQGRKSAVRGHHSDSEDDTSDHSASSSDSPDRKPVDRPERPLKYDFRANLDGITDSNDRINLILQKMSELKKVYMDVKAELADVERKRKKIKRRQREVLKTVKQIVPCA